MPVLCDPPPNISDQLLPNNLFIAESPEGGQESAVLLTSHDIPRSTPIGITTSNSHTMAD